MALSLQDISRKAVIRPPRIVLLGVEKIGKTSFACGSRFENGQRVAEGLNSPVVLPIKGEEGVDDMDVPSFPTLNSFMQLVEAQEALYRERHDHKTAVLDSMSAFERLIWQHLCEVHQVDSVEKVLGGYGKGFGEATSLFADVLAGFDALRRDKGMAVILIGHVKVKRFDDPAGDSYDQYRFDVKDEIANVAMRWADVILFANTKVAVKKEDVGFSKEKARGIDVTGGQRFVYTQKRPAHPGGGRGLYGELPYELPFDWASFEAAVGAVMEAREKKKETK